MVQLAFAAEQALDNLPQALGLGQLTKQHRHKLIPTTEPFGALLRAKRLGGSGKLMAIDQG
jgi:hypothetical protein